MCCGVGVGVGTQPSQLGNVRFLVLGLHLQFRVITSSLPGYKILQAIHRAHHTDATVCLLGVQGLNKVSYSFLFRSRVFCGLGLWVLTWR